MGFFEIANEADADGGEVEFVAFYVAAEELFLPAGADFDLAVARIDAVADYEMVGQSVLHAASAVGGVIFGGVAVFDRAVMHDDASPVARANVDARGLSTRDAE